MSKKKSICMVGILCVLGMFCIWLSHMQKLKPTDEVNVVPEKKHFIGVSLPAKTSYLKEVVSYMQLEAKEKQVSIEIHYADWDANVQEAQLRHFVRQGADAIIFAPVNAKSVLLSLKRIEEADIPLINVNMKVDASATEYIDTYVGSSSLEEAQKAAEVLVDYYQGKPAKIGIIEGSPGTDPQIYRTEGFLERMQSEPQIEIVGIGNGDWDREKTKLVTKDLLTKNPDVDAIYCHDTEMGMGAIEVIREKGLSNQVVVVGIGEDEEYLKALQRGEFLGIISQPASYEGRESVRCAVEAIRGKTLQPWYKDPAEVINKDNVVKFLDIY